MFIPLGWWGGACCNSSQQKRNVFSSHLCFWSHLICEDKQGFRLAQYSWLLACCVKWAFIETKCPHVSLLQWCDAFQSWPDESSAMHSRLVMHTESRPACLLQVSSEQSALGTLPLMDCFWTVVCLVELLVFTSNQFIIRFVNKTLSSHFSLKDLYVH